MRRAKKVSIDELAPWLLPDVPRGEVGPPIVWSELFGNDRPVEVEVGFGKGMFLTTAASARPDLNYFGVEIVRKYQLYTATRLLTRGLTNVRVACADARDLLRRRVAEASVAQVHVFFPDPWWKARHKKRRVFNEEFASTAARIVHPGGRLHIVTDVEEYFGVMREVVRPMPSFAELAAPTENSPTHDLDYLTNFERKFRKEGRPIYRALFERTDRPAPPYPEL